ncbi:hypothetical protein [Pseudooceanicola sp. LIPI14-2-Ac024]|uniref:hypothetical protein n=1 Tax=Pseudooceanicola sp. LIPI14-2-Ac024 TaxID=3344875 RepID=UPI0035D117FB
MASDLPPYFFRTRDNGATVFRVDTADRMRRIEMEQIAVVNIRSGEIKANGDRTLSEADLAAIRDWAAERQALQAERDIDDILRTVDHLNRTAHWAQGKASAAELERVSDELLLAMHDLRTVLVRKKAERAMRARDDA